jgi:hypothetical protein
MPEYDRERADSEIAREKLATPVEESQTDCGTLSAPPRESILMRKRCVGWGLIVIAALIAAFAAAKLLVRRPAPPPVVAHYTSAQASHAERSLESTRKALLGPPAVAPKPGQVSPGPASSLAASAVPGARTAVLQPPGQDRRAASAGRLVQVGLSQDDLNAFLATNPRIKALLAARGVQAVQIILQPPHNVICRAAVLTHGHRANVQIIGILKPDPKTLVCLQADKAEIGAVPLPASAVTQAARQIALRLAGKLEDRFPISIRTVRVAGGRLLLTGVRRKPQGQ